MSNLIEVEVPISKLFTVIEQNNNTTFVHDEEQFVNDFGYSIEIPDENGNWANVSALITKKDKIQEISFSDGTTLKCGSAHKLVVSKNTFRFARELLPGDIVHKASGETITVTTNNVIQNSDTVYDLTVDTNTHLYQTPNGLVHHNTETARQLADTLGVRLIKFDMSEYMEKHSVSKFIGSPPGYVGYEDGAAGGGLLVNALEEDPFAVLLLDEVEKAHPDVMNILLQLMDDGVITSSNGKTVSARSAVVIMTTNAGAAQASKKAIGFGRELNDGAQDEAIEKFFKPEFRNRLDAVVHFENLKPEHMLMVVDKFIDELNVLSKDKEVHIDLDKDARQWLATEGYDPGMGARPLSRVIQENIKKPLSRMMLFGELKDGGKVKITVEDETLKLTT